MNVLAFISLTTPLMLWGLGLLCLPLMAHLLNRQARRRIVFPTIRLLRESAANQSQLFKLRRLILLALRCLAVALIVWAFTKPVWLNAKTPESESGKGAAVVLLVDVSASTAQQTGGVSLINSIRVAAQRTLDSLQSTVDVADIVYASARPEAVFGQLSYNLGALRDQLEKLQPTNERADLPAAFALAGRLLTDHAGQRRLVIVSDMQDTNWRDVTGAGNSSAIGALLPRGTHITFVDVESIEAGNVALLSPRSSPLQPIAGQPMQLVVTVANYSDRETQSRVMLSVDGHAIDSAEIALSPWEKNEIAFDSKFDSEGDHEIVFSIPPDSLAADNQSFLVVKSVKHVPVILVSDDDAQDQGTSGYFITRALAPHGDASDRFEVRRLGSAEVTNETLSGAAAVFVGDIGALDSTPALALIEYAKAGGGVVLFCGDGPVQRNLILLDSLAGNDGFLPWTPGAARDLTPSGGALRITSGAWQSRLLRAFDERSQIALGQIAFRRVLAAVDIKPDAKVLLTFNDNAPALASRAFGTSQVVLANFSPALHAGDLGRYGAFVALMQSLVQELQPQQDSRIAPVVGQPFQFPAIAVKGTNRSIEVIGPDDKPVASAEQTAGESKTVVNLPRPSEPGLYRLNLNGKTLTSVAINVDSRESDLRRIDQQILHKQLEATGAELEIAGLDQSGPIVQLRGRPLWNWFVVIAMIALACEMAFLAMWKR